MAGFGRQIIGTAGNDVAVSADGRPIWKAGGITVDWGTVAAVTPDTTLPDGNIIKAGQKGLRFGQVLCKITEVESQSVTIADATGGYWTLTDGTNTTAHLADDITAADLQIAIRALGGNWSGVVVTGEAGGPYTLTLPGSVGNIGNLTADATHLTSGTTATVTVANVTQGVALTGGYGPYDPDASDGRQTLAKGACYILNQTQLQTPVFPGAVASDHPAVIEGGRVWKGRILATSGAHSLADGPTWTELEAVLPSLYYVQD